MYFSQAAVTVAIWRENNIAVGAARPHHQSQMQAHSKLCIQTHTHTRKHSPAVRTMLEEETKGTAKKLGSGTGLGLGIIKRRWEHRKHGMARTAPRIALRGPRSK